MGVGNTGKAERAKRLSPSEGKKLPVSELGEKGKSQSSSLGKGKQNEGRRDLYLLLRKTAKSSP